MVLLKVQVLKDFSLYDCSDLKTYQLMRWNGPDTLAVCLVHWGLPVKFLLSHIQFYLLLSPYLCFISFLCLDLYVLGDVALKS